MVPPAWQNLDCPSLVRNAAESLKNIKFLDARDLRQAAEIVDSTASYHFHSVRPSEPLSGPDRASRVLADEGQAQSGLPAEPKASPELLDAHLEIIPLITSKKLNIRSFTITDPSVNLIRGTNGKWTGQTIYF